MGGEEKSSKKKGTKAKVVGEEELKEDDDSGKVQENWAYNTLNGIKYCTLSRINSNIKFRKFGKKYYDHKPFSLMPLIIYLKSHLA